MLFINGSCNLQYNTLCATPQAQLYVAILCANTVDAESQNV